MSKYNTNQSETAINDLITGHQVAERWNCCRHTVSRHKQLKPVRLGARLVRYRLADVIAIEQAAQ